MKNLTLEIKGKRKTAQVEKIGKTLWLHLDGETFSYQPQSMGENTGGAQGNLDPSQILAPMPGKVIKVHKSIGDLVSLGETVVVMEAMKMEYALKSTADGSVSKMNCKEGDQVVLGDSLVLLEVKDV